MIPCSDLTMDPRVSAALRPRMTEGRETMPDRPHSVLIVRNWPPAGIFSLARPLAARGLEIVDVVAPEADWGAIDPLEADVAVILGGPQSVYQEQEFPYIPPQIALAERRLAAGRATVGVCLGAQVLVRALGARVYQGEAEEIGWGPITLTEAGEASALAPLGADGLELVHWHRDTFDVPEGAVRLAETPLYANQAFAYGGHGLALQFHPEATVEAVACWTEDMDEAGPSGPYRRVDPSALREGARQHAAILEQRAVAFFDRWLDEALGEPALKAGNVGPSQV